VPTVGGIRGGNAFDVVPSDVTMRGTPRRFVPEAGDRLEGRATRIVRATAQAEGPKPRRPSPAPVRR
jgi:hippurate hydrolase